MKLSFFNNIGEQFAVSHRRFPVTMLVSFAACAFVWWYMQSEYLASRGNHYDLLVKNLWAYLQIAFLLILAVPLSFCVHIWQEQHQYSRKSWVLWLGLLGFLLAFGASGDWSGKEKEVFIVRFLVFGLAAHFLVAFAPYWQSTKVSAFWEYNKTLFIRILTAFVYSFTLSGGLSLALLAIEKLFNVEIEATFYQFIWVFLNGYFNTSFFLAGFPKSLTDFDEIQEYPLPLKYFTQYVLLPLVLIYLLILYCYGGKILMAWSLPKGWVSNLVLASAIFGILAFLLIHPLKNINAWVRQFNRLFYFILLPLLVLLFIAIFVRIQEYGITEPRYFVAALAVWLLGITLYFIISKQDDIRWIPISLFFAAVLSVLGPWGAFSVSDSSQFNRLKNALEQAKFLKDGKIAVANQKDLDSTLIRQVSASFGYFAGRERFAKLQPLFKQNLHDLDTLNNWQREEKLYEWSKIPKNIEEVRPYMLKRFFVETSTIASVKRYDYLLNDSSFFIREQKSNGQTQSIKNVQITTKTEHTGKINISVNQELFTFDLHQEISKLDKLYQSKEQQLEPDKLFFTQAGKNWEIGIQIFDTSFYENASDSTLRFEQINMNILLRKR